MKKQGIPAEQTALFFWTGVVLFVWDAAHANFGSALYALGIAVAFALIFDRDHGDWHQGNAVSETLP